MSRAERRAERLLRWYPRAWRERYGDEFSELLLADIAERPRSWSRGLDVARRGVAVRLGVGGVVEAGSRLAVVVCAGAAFMLFGAAVWSQLAIGWQWSRPSAPATAAAIVAMSCLLALFAALGLVGAAPVLWAVVSRFATGGGRASGSSRSRCASPERRSR